MSGINIFILFGWKWSVSIKIKINLVNDYNTDLILLIPALSIEFIYAAFPSDSPISHQVHSPNFNLLQFAAWSRGRDSRLAARDLRFTPGSSVTDSILEVSWLISRQVHSREQKFVHVFTNTLQSSFALLEARARNS